MAQAMSEPSSPAVTLFNSPMETGVRAAIVLDALYPRALDLARVTWLDHLVVHTADLGGPPSLHPDIPQRTGELLVRRRLVEDGLNLMRKLHLIEARSTDEGIFYLASEEATAFCDSLRSEYGRELKHRAEWLATYLRDRTDDEIEHLINAKIGRWSAEFQGEIGPESEAG
jgi:hypothetical protein